MALTLDSLTTGTNEQIRVLAEVTASSNDAIYISSDPSQSEWGRALPGSDFTWSSGELVNVVRASYGSVGIDFASLPSDIENRPTLFVLYETASGTQTFQEISSATSYVDSDTFWYTASGGFLDHDYYAGDRVLFVLADAGSVRVVTSAPASGEIELGALSIQATPTVNFNPTGTIDIGNLEITATPTVNFNPRGNLQLGELEITATPTVNFNPTGTIDIGELELTGHPRHRGLRSVVHPDAPGEIWRAEWRGADINGFRELGDNTLIVNLAGVGELSGTEFAGPKTLIQHTIHNAHLNPLFPVINTNFFLYIAVIDRLGEVTLFTRRFVVSRSDASSSRYYFDPASLPVYPDDTEWIFIVATAPPQIGPPDFRPTGTISAGALSMRGFLHNRGEHELAIWAATKGRNEFLRVLVRDIPQPPMSATDTYALWSDGQHADYPDRVARLNQAPDVIWPPFGEEDPLSAIVMEANGDLTILHAYTPGTPAFDTFFSVGDTSAVPLLITQSPGGSVRVLRYSPPTLVEDDRMRFGALGTDYRSGLEAGTDILLVLAETGSVTWLPEKNFDLPVQRSTEGMQITWTERRFLREDDYVPVLRGIVPRVPPRPATPWTANFRLGGVVMRGSLTVAGLEEFAYFGDISRLTVGENESTRILISSLPQSLSAEATLWSDGTLDSVPAVGAIDRNSNLEYATGRLWRQVRFDSSNRLWLDADLSGDLVDELAFGEWDVLPIWVVAIGADGAQQVFTADGASMVEVNDVESPLWDGAAWELGTEAGTAIRAAEQVLIVIADADSVQVSPQFGGVGA